MGATWIPVLAFAAFVVAWCVDRVEVRRAVRRHRMLVLVPYRPPLDMPWRTPKDHPRTHRDEYADAVTARLADEARHRRRALSQRRTMT